MSQPAIRLAQRGIPGFREYRVTGLGEVTRVTLRPWRDSPLPPKWPAHPLWMMGSTPGTPPLLRISSQAGHFAPRLVTVEECETGKLLGTLRRKGWAFGSNPPLWTVLDADGAELTELRRTRNPTGYWGNVWHGDLPDCYVYSKCSIELARASGKWTWVESWYDLEVQAPRVEVRLLVCGLVIALLDREVLTNQ